MENDLISRKANSPKLKSPPWDTSKRGVGDN